MDDELDDLLPPDTNLCQREKGWMKIFNRYKNITDAEGGHAVDYDLDELSDLAESDNNANGAMSDESVSPPEFVTENPSDDDAAVDSSAAEKQLQQQVQLACRRRLDNWAAKGLHVPVIDGIPDELGAPEAIDSWLAQSLLPFAAGGGGVNASISNVNVMHHSTSTMTSSSSVSHNAQHKVHTKTVTTIVKRVLVHSSTSGAATIGLNESPASDSVFVSPPPKLAIKDVVPSTAPTTMTAAAQKPRHHHGPPKRTARMPSSSSSHSSDTESNAVQFRVSPNQHRDRSPLTFRKTPHTVLHKSRTTHDAKAANKLRLGSTVQRAIEKLPIRPCLKNASRRRLSRSDDDEDCSTVEIESNKPKAGSSACATKPMRQCLKRELASLRFPASGDEQRESYSSDDDDGQSAPVKTRMRLNNKTAATNKLPQKSKDSKQTNIDGVSSESEELDGNRQPDKARTKQTHKKLSNKSPQKDKKACPKTKTLTKKLGDDRDVAIKQSKVEVDQKKNIQQSNRACESDNMASQQLRNTCRNKLSPSISSESDTEWLPKAQNKPKQPPVNTKMLDSIANQKPAAKPTIKTIQQQQKQPSKVIVISDGPDSDTKSAPKLPQKERVQVHVPGARDMPPNGKVTHSKHNRLAAADIKENVDPKKKVQRPREHQVQEKKAASPAIQHKKLAAKSKLADHPQSKKPSGRKKKIRLSDSEDSADAVPIARVARDLPTKSTVETSKKVSGRTNSDVSSGANPNNTSLSNSSGGNNTDDRMASDLQQLNIERTPSQRRLQHQRKQRNAAQQPHSHTNRARGSPDRRQRTPSPSAAKQPHRSRSISRSGSRARQRSPHRTPDKPLTLGRSKRTKGAVRDDVAMTQNEDLRRDLQQSQGVRILRSPPVAQTVVGSPPKPLSLNALRDSQRFMPPPARIPKQRGRPRNPELPNGAVAKPPPPASSASADTTDCIAAVADFNTNGTISTMTTTGDGDFQQQLHSTAASNLSALSNSTINRSASTSSMVLFEPTVNSTAMSDTFSITLREVAARMQLTEMQRQQMFPNRRDDEVLYKLPANTMYTLHWKSRPEPPAAVQKQQKQQQQQKTQPQQKQRPTTTNDSDSDESESDEDILDRMRYVPVLKRHMS